MNKRFGKKRNSILLPMKITLSFYTEHLIFVFLGKEKFKKENREKSVRESKIKVM